MAEDLLSVGDIIVLDVDSDSTIATQGFSDVHVFANLEQTGLNSCESSFIVRPQQNYAAEYNLREVLERDSVDREAARVMPKYRQIFDERENEKRLNAREFEHKLGMEVRYGMVVQLQHMSSEKYLQVTRQRMEHRSGRKVTVDRNAGDAAWFRVMPSLRVHSEGDPVHVGDRVRLESIVNGMSLCVAADEASSDAEGRGGLYREVFGGRLKDATPLQLRVFRGWSEHSTRDRMLLGAEPMRLLHKEGDGALSAPIAALDPDAAVASAADGTGIVGVPVVATGADEMGSSMAVWNFERVDKESGRPVRVCGGDRLEWGGAVRIVHTSTGHALALDAPEPDDELLATSPRAPKPTPPKFGAKAPAPVAAAPVGVDDKKMFKKPFLVGDASSKPLETLFELEPQYDVSGQVHARSPEGCEHPRALQRAVNTHARSRGL